MGNGRRDPSNARSQSRDGPTKGNGLLAYGGLNGDSTRPSKPKYMNPNRTTMGEMKRRVAAILEFISRIQVEMAGEKTPPTAGAVVVTAASTKTATVVKGVGSTGTDLPKITLSTSTAAGGVAVGAGGNVNEAGSPPTSSSSMTATVEASTTSANASSGNSSQSQDPATALVALEREFSELSSLEMMDVLTRKLVLWQKDYGKYGDK